MPKCIRTVIRELRKAMRHYAKSRVQLFCIGPITCPSKPMHEIKGLDYFPISLSPYLELVIIVMRFGLAYMLILMR